MIMFFVADLLLGVFVGLGSKSRAFFAVIFGLLFWPTFVLSGLYTGILDFVAGIGFLKNNVDSMWVYVFGTFLLLVLFGALILWLLTGKNLDEHTRNVRLLSFAIPYVIGAIIAIAFVLFMTMASSLSVPGY